jgi:hypothetical protein
MLPIEPSDHPDFISTLARPAIAVVQCHSCGYEPPRPDHPPRQCPKCYGGSWERFIWRGKLDDALPPERRADNPHAAIARAHQQLRMA